MKKATGTFEVETHKGLKMVDPNYEINQGTKDFPIDEKFIPSITFIFDNSRIFHQLPPQPYVNGGWEDKDVEDAVARYLKNISKD